MASVIDAKAAYEQSAPPASASSGMATHSRPPTPFNACLTFHSHIRGSNCPRRIPLFEINPVPRLVTYRST